MVTKNLRKKEKKDLTGPTLLEITGYPTNRELTVSVGLATIIRVIRSHSKIGTPRLECVFAEFHAWPGMVLWALLYVSDYALTITCARLYKQQQTIAFEGSYEITPFYQRDIEILTGI